MWRSHLLEADAHTRSPAASLDTRCAPGECNCDFFNRAVAAYRALEICGILICARHDAPALLRLLRLPRRLHHVCARTATALLRVALPLRRGACFKRSVLYRLVLSKLANSVCAPSAKYYCLMRLLLPLPCRMGARASLLLKVGAAYISCAGANSSTGASHYACLCTFSRTSGVDAGISLFSSPVLECLVDSWFPCAARLARRACRSAWCVRPEPRAPATCVPCVLL